MGLFIQVMDIDFWVVKLLSMVDIQLLRQIIFDYSEKIYGYHLTEEVITMFEEFVRERITQLRLKKGVSEYQMSYDLGHSRGYIYNFSSGKALPPLKEFLAICDYFEITPQQFFDTSTQNPKLIQKALEGMRRLDEDDMLMLLGIINRLLKK